LGILKFIPYDKLPRKAVIVAEEHSYKQTASILRQVHYAPELSGRVSPHADKKDALGSISEMKQLLYTTGVNEVTFCINGLTYADVFRQMQLCGKEYEYKIHLPGSHSFVGSNSSNTSGDLYTIDRRFNLSDFAQVRNKRLLDMAGAVLLLLLLPFVFFAVKNAGKMVVNCIKVLAGKLTWVGYATGVSHKYLPPIRSGVIQPFNILNDYQPTNEVKVHINTTYAEHYSTISDLNLILKNFRYLGGE
jgi:O-antigen biosynthesis protein